MSSIARVLAMGLCLQTVGCAHWLQSLGATYAPATQVRADDPFFQENAARKYHALQAVYVGQLSQSSCTVASATMVVNAINAARRRPPATQDQVLSTDHTGRWAAAVANDMAPGVSLESFALLLMQTLHAFGIQRMAVDVMHVADETQSTLQTLQSALEKSEAQAQSYFIIANFRQSSYLGQGGPEGHMSPVGAYDARRDRVLVFDVDRAFFQPYWVPTSLFLAGMHTPDDDTGEMRGYLIVRFPD